jgi:hypothetical protein
MSTLNEKAEPTTNVLTITRPTPTQRSPQTSGLSPIEDIESTHSLTPTNTHEKSDSPTHSTSAFSPFYNPRSTRLSLEAQKTESKQNINVISTPYDTDLEAGPNLTPSRTHASNGLLKNKTNNTGSTTNGKLLDRSVWPGHREMKLKKKAMRRAKSKHMLCGCMAHLDKRTKIWVKVLIALLVVGAAVGVGVGISRAVGGGVWKNKSSSNSAIEGSQK